MREYEVSQVLNHLEDDKRYEMVKSEQEGSNAAQSRYRETNQDIEEEIEEETKEQEMKLLSQQPKLFNQMSETTETPFKASNELLLEDGKTASKVAEPGFITHQHPISHHSSSKLRKTRLRECRVSDWSEWSECKNGCSVTSRRRSVLSGSRRSVCPPLRQTRWCGSLDSLQLNDMKNCPS